MDVQRFLEEHEITENPFGAEEARHDPVFDRIVARGGMAHPELTKILGSPDRPHTSVVFGEKGTGKTALRLLMARRVLEHNKEHPGQRTLLLAHDDFNPMLDVMGRNKARMGMRRARDPDRLLASIRLEDHQDAILSLAVRKIVDGLLGQPQGDEPMTMPQPLAERIKEMPRETRVDLAVLAALYDAPRGGASALARWTRVRRKLRLGWRFLISPLQFGAIIATIAAFAFLLLPIAVDTLGISDVEPQDWMVWVGRVFAGVASFLWIWWLGRRLRIWYMARRILRECPAVDRQPADMRKILQSLAPHDRTSHPWPRTGGDGVHARYELTEMLMGVLRALGHTAVIVLVDRVDEPTLVAGRPERMRRLIWPMFDSKFLQQDQIGMKLLLPMELRYLIHKESAAFFQEARLDKQSLVDRLAWTGAILYDLCTARLRACHRNPDSDVSLTDLFTEDVGRNTLVEVLGQMQQPRDAFKMMYAVLLEHCRNVTEEQPEYRIPRLTLEAVRRSQAQRINELQRGLSPA